MQLLRSWLTGLAAFGLIGATCQDVTEVAVTVGAAWLEVSCTNNPQDYCESALTLSETLALSLQQRRPGYVPAPEDREPDEEVRSRSASLTLDSVLLDSARAVSVHDGERIPVAEELRLLLRPSADAWLYVMWVDAAGRVHPLHSSPGDAAGAVPAGTVLTLPVDPSIRSQKGIEHLYVAASLAPREDLSQTLASFMTRTRSAPGPARVGKPSVVTRGAESTGPVAPIEGVVPERFLAAGDDLVVTRWIRSE